MASSAKRKSSSSKSEATGDVLGFWEEQAQKHGASDLATNPDQHYRKLEISRLLHVMEQLKPDVILDVGCGNGFTTLEIAQKFPHTTVVGIDFSPEMIKHANKNAIANTEFHVGDVLSLSRNSNLGLNSFDTVVSTRCLINLANWDEQKIGILEMRKMLAPNGNMILVENFKEGLANLNAVRAKFGLHPIQERWHNFYIPQDEMIKFLQSQSHNLAMEYTENIGNMYYIASRVIYAKMCKDQGIEPDYNNQINEIAKDLPTFGEFYACSPNFLTVLKNVSGRGQKWASNPKPS